MEQKDKTIAGKDETIEALTKERNDATAQLSTLNAQLSELKAANEKLTKQVDSLKAEVKELSEKETPMVNAESGVPAGNGTGEAPKEAKKCRITSDMSYEEIRAVKKAEREAKK